MAWNPVQVDFGRGIASLMSNAQQGISDLGRVAGQYLDRVTAEDREKQRQKERGEDVLFRQQQADTAKAQADRLFAVQGSQENREAEKFAIEKATNEAQAKGSEYLNAARQNVVTPQQADAILAAYNKNPRADVLGMQAKAVQQYNRSLPMQKQFLGNVNIDQGPMEQTIQTVNPTTGMVEDRILSVAPNMKEAQARKDMILGDLDKRIESEADRQQRLDLARMQEAGANARNKASIAATKQQSQQPIKMSKILPDGRVQEVNVYTPEQVKAAQGEKFMLGTVGGGYRPQGTSSTDKSVYAAPQAKLLSDKWGGYDAPKILSMAETLRKANPKMSADTALGIVEDVASGGWTDSVSVGDVMDRALDLGYTGKILKK